MYTSGANTNIRGVHFTVDNVHGFSVFDGYWAWLETIELGPDICGICCWVTLLCNDISQGFIASTAED